MNAPGKARARAQTRVVSRRTDRIPAPDLVQRRFEADALNKLCVADMAYVPTWAGFIFLAVVLAVFSRRVVGWTIGHEMHADLVLKGR